MDENSQSSIFDGEITGIRFGLATQKEIVSRILSWLFACSCYLKHFSWCNGFLESFVVSSD
jgi:hypothetical protein